MKVLQAVWLKEPLAMEFSDVHIYGGRPEFLRTHVIGTEPVPHKLTLAGLPSWHGVAGSFSVSVDGSGLNRSLKLERSEAGIWSSNVTATEREPPLPLHTELPELEGAVDIDLGLSPLTNTLPVLRHGLLKDGPPVEVKVAWISVPDLGVQVEEQRYTPLHATDRGYLVRFESLDGSFSADIEFDYDGLVIDYPGIARRVG